MSPAELLGKAFDHYGRESFLMRDLNFRVDAQCLQDCGSFKPGKQRRKLGQIPGVAKLKSLDVIDPKVTIYDKWQQLRTQEQQCREGAGHPAIAVLIGVDLCEAVVEPSRHDDRILRFVLGEPAEEIIHLSVDIQGRTILVQFSVRTFRIVRLLFELPFEQRYLMPMAKLVYRRSRVLMPRENGMELVNDTLRKVTVLGDTVHHEMNGCFLIPQDVNQAGRLDVGAGMRYEILNESMSY